MPAGPKPLSPAHSATLWAAPQLCGENIDLPSLGTGRRDLGPADIRNALALYGMVLNLALGIALAIAVLLYR